MGRTKNVPRRRSGGSEVRAAADSRAWKTIIATSYRIFSMMFVESGLDGCPALFLTDDSEAALSSAGMLRRWTVSGMTAMSDVPRINIAKPISIGSHGDVSISFEATKGDISPPSRVPTVIRKKALDLYRF